MAEAALNMGAPAAASASTRLVRCRAGPRRPHARPLPSGRRLLALKSFALRPSSSLSSEFFGNVRLVSGSAVPIPLKRKGRFSVLAMAGDVRSSGDLAILIKN